MLISWTSIPNKYCLRQPKFWQLKMIYHMMIFIRNIFFCQTLILFINESSSKYNTEFRVQIFRGGLEIYEWFLWRANRDIASRLRKTRRTGCLSHPRAHFVVQESSTRTEGSITQIIERWTGTCRFGSPPSPPRVFWFLSQVANNTAGCAR